MSGQELRVISTESTDFLSKKQVRQFVTTIPELPIYQREIYARQPLPGRYFQVLIELIYDAALRMGEGREVKVEDLDLEYARINLPRTKTGWDWCKCATHEKRRLISCDKNHNKCEGRGKLRRPQSTTLSVPMAKKLHKFIQEEKLQSWQYLFRSPSFPKQSISDHWVWEWTREVGRLCDFKIFAERKHRIIKDVYTHLFRRSRAIQMDIDGATLGTISRKLRHMDVKTTTTYIQSSISDLQKWEKELGTWF